MRCAEVLSLQPKAYHGVQLKLHPLRTHRMHHVMPIFKATVTILPSIRFSHSVAYAGYMHLLKVSPYAWRQAMIPILSALLVISLKTRIIGSCFIYMSNASTRFPYLF